MVIYIDKTIGEHGKAFKLTEDEMMFFAELAIAHQHGNSLLCGEISSIEWLMASLEGVQGSLYRKVLGKYAETKIIVDAVETLLVISYDESPCVPEFISKKARFLTVGEAINHRINEKCILLAENLSDCEFYELLAYRYQCLSSRVMKGTVVSFQHEQGGGNTTNIVYKKCVNIDKRLTLCIVDSDTKYGATKQYPEIPKGDTAKKLISTDATFAGSTAAKICHLFCLPVHEVENLIPLSVLKDIADSEKPDMALGVQYIEKLLASGKTDAILYYDFKNGGNKVKTDPSVTYWIEIADIIDDDSFPVLCSKVLEKAISYLSFSLPSGKKRVETVSVDGYLDSFWNDIGLKVFSWGCSNRPESS